MRMHLAPMRPLQRSASRRWTCPTVAVLCWVLLGSPSIAQTAPAPAPPLTDLGQTVWVTTTQRLKTRVFESPTLGNQPILVVVLHGDSPKSPPTYQYRFAATAAAAMTDAVVAAVLRPGYSDGLDRSDGMRGETTGDNYTPEVIDAVASAISELRGRYHPRRVVMVGHSGGAAITADLLGQRGNLVDAALLVSCPCDLAEWRKHMQSIKGGAIWERPVRSLSPIAVAADIPASARVWMLVGSDDQITPPALTLAYADALRNRGIAVDVTVAPGLPHNILLAPVALDRLKDLVAAIDSR